MQTRLHRVFHIGQRRFARCPLFRLDALFKDHGGDSRVRTGDLLLARQALSQLSYIPDYSRHRVPSKLNNVTPSSLGLLT